MRICCRTSCATEFVGCSLLVFFRISLLRHIGCSCVFPSVRGGLRLTVPSSAPPPFDTDEKTHEQLDHHTNLKQTSATFKLKHFNVAQHILKHMRICVWRRQGLATYACGGGGCVGNCCILAKFCKYALYYSTVCAPMAQRIEHQTSNLAVVGSNPTGRTTFI